MEQQAKIGSDGHQRLRLAIAGFGTVGSAVARILIEQSSGASSFELAYILNRRIAEKRVDWVPGSVRWTEDIDEVLDSDIDVFVELVGGLDPAGTWVRRALASGKSVVTANKALIAARGRGAERAGVPASAAPGLWRIGGWGRAGALRVAGGAGGRSTGAGERHPERDVQLHPDAHGAGGDLVCRCAAGSAARRLCRGRPERRCGWLRCTREDHDPEPRGAGRGCRSGDGAVPVDPADHGGGFALCGGAGMHHPADLACRGAGGRTAHRRAADAGGARAAACARGGARRTLS